MKQEEYLSTMMLRCSLLKGSLSQLSLSAGRRLVFLVAIALISSSAVAFGQAGHLDSTFGSARQPAPESSLLDSLSGPEVCEPHLVRHGSDKFRVEEVEDLDRECGSDARTRHHRSVSL